MKINEIYNENCLLTMKAMSDEFIDLVVTSPPYDNLRDYKGYSFEFEDIVRELYRVMKTGGVVVWVVGDATVNGSETGTSFRQALFFKETGFNIHDTMIYQKQNPVPLRHNRYNQEFEYMFVFSKGKPTTFNPIMEKSKYGGQTNWGNTIRYNVDGSLNITPKKTINEYKVIGNIFKYLTGSTQNTGKNHPAVFPEKLAEDHIISWSNEGDLVYDPFMGSGTVAKMCLVHNRNYIGSEISPEYCQEIERNICDLKEIKNIEKNTKRLF